MEEVPAHVHLGPIVPNILSRYGDHETCFTNIQCRRFERNLFKCCSTAPRRVLGVRLSLSHFSGYKVKKEPLEPWILRAFTGPENDDDLILGPTHLDGPALATEVLSYPNHEYIRWYRGITRVYIGNLANRDTRSHGYQPAGVDRQMMEVDDMASVVIQEPPSFPSQMAVFAKKVQTIIRRGAREEPGRGAGGGHPPVPPFPGRHEHVDPGHVEVEREEWTDDIDVVQHYEFWHRVGKKTTRDAYGPYFTGVVRKSWTLPTTQMISHDELVRKILKYRDMDPNLWNVRMTMRVPSYYEVHRMFYFNLYSMNNDEEMRYLWNIPPHHAKEVIHILFQTPLNPVNPVNLVTENIVPQWESNQWFSIARYDYTHSGAFLNMSSDSPIDDLVESGTIRLLDWNDSMTDIQLGMRFVDKVQAISVVLANNPKIPVSNIIQEVQCVEKMSQEQILMCRRYIRDKCTEKLTKRIFIRS
ncbi:hypothetical protein M9H77_19366 [Catharanthus roseus]|uniref:Uncharacterized protein n=1 Tax=Catharanthus roseus TaxID=4058 RepID=A0ACC0BA62_CATRO|nr:hypothetical protein M9H77_19366 [Catharanthus roseus]